jgi:hypothetical protein
VYFARKTDTGTLEVYRRTVAVVDGIAQPLHVDHVASHANDRSADRPAGSEADEEDVIRYTRLFSSRARRVDEDPPQLEWVPLRENMARSNGYKLDFDVLLPRRGSRGRNAVHPGRHDDEVLRVVRQPDDI